MQALLAARAAYAGNGMVVKTDTERVRAQPQDGPGAARLSTDLWLAEDAVPR